jgi:hypothetical protein
MATATPDLTPAAHPAAPRHGCSQPRRPRPVPAWRLARTASPTFLPAARLPTAGRDRPRMRFTWNQPRQSSRPTQELLRRGPRLRRRAKPEALATPRDRRAACPEARPLRRVAGRPPEIMREVLQPPRPPHRGRQSGPAQAPALPDRAASPRSQMGTTRAAPRLWKRQPEKTPAFPCSSLRTVPPTAPRRMARSARKDRHRGLGR